MAPIKFAGIYSQWDEEYTKSYAKKLEEMGFSTKIITYNNKNVVAYCHRTFSRIEALSYLDKIIEG